MIMTFCNMTPVVSQVIISGMEKPAQAFSFSELKMSFRQTAHCCMLHVVNEDASMHPCALCKRIRLHSAQHTGHTGHTMPP